MRDSKKIVSKIMHRMQADSLKEMYQEAGWMGQYMKRYWLSILFYVGMGILGTVSGFAGSIVSKYLIDTVTGKRTEAIGMLIALVIGFAAGNIVVKALASRMSAKISVSVQNEIRAEIYDRIIYTDWEALHEYRSGDLLNRLSQDVNIVAGSVINWLPELVTRTVQFIGAFVIISYYDITMAVIALLSAPVTLLISRVLIRRMRTYNKEMREVTSRMMSFQNDSFQNLQTLKAFDLMEDFSDKMKEIQGEYEEKMLDYNKFSIYISSFMTAVGTAVSYICFLWGVYRLWSGAITYGTMTLFLQMAGQVSNGFSGVVKLFPGAISALTSAGRLMGVTELKKEKMLCQNEVEALQETAGDGLYVEMHGVRMTYKEGNTVLDNAVFEARPGEIVAVIGPSGEGKTTFVRLLLGLIYPEEGQVLLRDRSGRSCEVSALTRRFFSYVPQGNTVFTGTVEENLRLAAPKADEEAMMKALWAGCADEFVQEQEHGLKQMIGERGIGFSEGQAQRIAIARAVLRDAPILLLDEATSALDTGIEEIVLNRIMRHREHKTCIVTTHRPSVLAMCDHIYEVNGNELKKVR